jgi:hypothetical protein
MGKKSAHTGMSPKDRSINLMDKFISKSMNRDKNQPRKPALYKSADRPIHMWPLKDQIEYWENRSIEDRFKDQYPVYSFWIAEVQKLSKVHSSFFNDQVLRLKTEVQEMYDAKMLPKDAVMVLRKHGVY